MNSWFDIFSLDATGTPNSVEDVYKMYNQQDLHESADLLLKMVEEEANKF